MAAGLDADEEGSEGVSYGMMLVQRPSTFRIASSASGLSQTELGSYLGLILVQSQQAVASDAARVGLDSLDRGLPVTDHAGFFARMTRRRANDEQAASAVAGGCKAPSRGHSTQGVLVG